MESDALGLDVGRFRVLRRVIERRRAFSCHASARLVCLLARLLVCLFAFVTVVIRRQSNCAAKLTGQPAGSLHIAGLKMETANWKLKIGN